MQKIATAKINDYRCGVLHSQEVSEDDAQGEVPYSLGATTISEIRCLRLQIESYPSRLRVVEHNCDRFAYLKESVSQVSLMRCTMVVRIRLSVCGIPSAGN